MSIQLLFVPPGFIADERDGIEIAPQWTRDSTYLSVVVFSFVKEIWVYYIYESWGDTGHEMELGNFCSLGNLLTFSKALINVKQ